MKWEVFKVGLMVLIMTIPSMVHSQSEFALLNSPYHEQLPVLSPDGSTFYFVRSNHPENIGGEKDKGDIWFSQLDESGKWGTPFNLGKPLNNTEWNGIIGFSKDGNTMYLYNHYSTSGRPKSQGISRSVKTENGWTYPTPLDIEYFMTKSDLYGVSFSDNGKIMVLSLESYGSHGAEDIYVSFLQPTGRWSQPRNIGPDINTDKQELTPYLMSDNETLLFSSNGLGGYGSQDVFLSKRLDETWKKWTKPQNLTEKINTEGQELSFRFISEEEAVFVSTQNSDGYGDIKIRRFDQNELVDILTNTTLMAALATQEPIDQPTIDLTNVPEMKEGDFSFNVIGFVNHGTTNKPLRSKLNLYKEGQLILSTNTGENGNYTLGITSAGNYKIEIELEGFIKAYEDITVENPSGLAEVNFILFPLEVGTTMNLNHVHYYQGTPKLIESSYEQLDIIANLMKDNPKMEIELSGYTDNRGSPRLNLELSHQRVETVKNYLAGQGVNVKRLSGKGYGGSRPIASNASEETRRLNRRVEFTIIKN